MFKVSSESSHLLRIVRRCKYPSKGQSSSKSSKDKSHDVDVSNLANEQHQGQIRKKELKCIWTGGKTTFRHMTQFCAMWRNIWKLYPQLIHYSESKKSKKSLVWVMLDDIFLDENNSSCTVRPQFVFITVHYFMDSYPLVSKGESTAKISKVPLTPLLWA